MNRRTFLTRSTGALLGVSGGGMILHALAQDGNQAAGMINQAVQQSIDQSLVWLSRQQHNGGNFDGAFGTNNYIGNVAVTALCGLAFMAGGHQPNRGRYGENVNKVVRYLLRCEDPNTPGFLNARQAGFHGPMYGHGFATLFLAEVYGMVNDPEMRSALRGLLGRSVRCILDAQNRNREGGWRYTPTSTDADLSVTVCQIMALRAARNAGIAVPKSNADRCTDYVKRCQDQNSGGFRYQAGGFGGGAGFARTAAGVVALNSAGVYLETEKGGESVKRGLDYLMRQRPGGGGGGFLGGGEMGFHYDYGHYYAVQAMWTAGGQYWRTWYPAIRDELLQNRRQDGSWQRNLMCTHYCTAMALIILQVPNNYLPILQR
jgi:prenyltransferase beta subunit